MIIMVSYWYTPKQFLFTFRFTDEPLSLPNFFLRDEDSYTKLCRNVARYISRGVRVEKAFEACGVRSHTYGRWLKSYREELDAGKLDTPLIRLFNEVYTADANLDLTLHDLAMDLVLDGDEKMLHFLMKHRLGYNTQRTELELSNKGDTPFTVNIVGMTDTVKPPEPASEEDFVKRQEAREERKREDNKKISLVDENGEIISG